MNKLTRTILENNLPAVFTGNDLRQLEPDDHIRHCQISRAVASGDIMRIRRGFYTLNKIFRKGVINEHLLANMLVPDSYISFETALWDAGWIPEFVFEIASVSMRRSFEIETPFAVFSYTRIRQKNMFSGTYTIGIGDHAVPEAKPLKALADYVYSFGYNWTDLRPLEYSLRIDIENLKTLTAGDFDEIQGNYDTANVENFLDGIRRELKL